MMTLALGFPAILSDAKDWTITKKFIALLMTISLDLLLISTQLPSL
jgi:hypothetical protein